MRVIVVVKEFLFSFRGFIHKARLYILILSFFYGDNICLFFDER